MNVSQPAISLAVKKLEQALGVALFERRHRSIRLTDAGQRLHADVAFGLRQIEKSVAEIGMQASGQHVTLACSTAFAHYWMVPRLATFKQANPDIEIRLQTTDKDIEITREPVSLAVRRGNGCWQGYESLLIARDRIYPVASPAYLACSPGLPDAGAIPGHKLIHLEEPYRSRPDWRDFLASHGVAYRDDGTGLRLNDYALVIEACLAGEGIAFGWDHLVGRLVGQGRLVRVTATCLEEPLGHYVIWPSNRPLSGRAALFLDWLRSQAE